VLLPSRRNHIGIYAGFPDSIYALADRRWSPWRAWDAADGSGRRAVLRDLPAAEPGHPEAGYYLFAVQAMDEAGAVTPVFDDRTEGKNNAVRMFVNGLVGPMLVVTERYLGTYTFLGRTNAVSIDIASGQPIQFRFSADASSYGGSITAFRYGWDVRDPAQDDSCSTATSVPLRAFPGGVHRLSVEVRDDAGNTTGATFALNIRNVTRRRDLLFVDDTTQPQAGHEGIEDQRWAAVCDSIARRGGLRFEPGRDIYDVSEHSHFPPPLSLVFEYETVIWAVVNATRGSALRELATFFDPYVERNRNRIGRFNYLELYVENGGHLWVSGAQPAHVLWPWGDRPQEQQLPVNVVHWDDYIDPHPEQDSVGVLSFLYKLGVECFDLGAGGRAPQPRGDRQEQLCRGFRLAHGVSLPGAPPTLETDSRWPQPPDPLLNPQRCRPNIEIYDMPRFMARETPRLDPPEGLLFTPYVYVSGVLADEHTLYPNTADEQPAVVLRKTYPHELFYTRALCGFEPWLLRLDSHVGRAGRRHRAPRHGA
jgi:hypothetical protein